MEIFHDEPATEQFTPLADFQAQTPESFHEGPAVLYHCSRNVSLSANGVELHSSNPLHILFAEAARRAPSHDVDDESTQILITDQIDVWINSEWVLQSLVTPPKLIHRRFMLYSQIQKTGLSIPYPQISLHALQNNSSVFLQLLTATGPVFDDHDPSGCCDLTVTPSSPTADGCPSEAQNMYTALSACADLHPDPQDQESGGEGADIDIDDDAVAPYSVLGDTVQSALPPPMPGSGGWITAENVDQYFGEDGSFREDQVAALGAGAGTTRTRDQPNGTDEPTAQDDVKWQRTD